MKKINYMLSMLLLFLTAVSCKKDFLNQEPKGQYNEATTWKDPSLIQAFVNNVYHGIPHGFSNIMMSSLVDESV